MAIFTRVISGLILLDIAGTWSYLSIKAGTMQVFNKDLLIAAGILFAGEKGIDAFLQWKGIFPKKKEVKNVTGSSSS